MLKKIMVLLLLFVFVTVSISYAVEQKVVMEIEGMVCEL